MWQSLTVLVKIFYIHKALLFTQKLYLLVVDGDSPDQAYSSHYISPAHVDSQHPQSRHGHQTPTYQPHGYSETELPSPAYVLDLQQLQMQSHPEQDPENTDLPLPLLHDD